MNAHDQPHPTVPTKVYVINGMDIVPHYTKPGIYVAPGGAQYLEHFLQSIATEIKELMLWPRLESK